MRGLRLFVCIVWQNPVETCDFRFDFIKKVDAFEPLCGGDNQMAQKTV